MAAKNKQRNTLSALRPGRRQSTPSQTAFEVREEGERLKALLAAAKEELAQLRARATEEVGSLKSKVDDTRSACKDLESSARRDCFVDRCIGMVSYPE